MAGKEVPVPQAPPGTPQCDGCKNFRPGDQTCHAHPPGLHSGGIESIFPQVKITDWCGDYSSGTYPGKP